MSRPLFAWLLVVAVIPALPAAAPDDAKPEDFVIVQKGTLPIIISAPHGGRKKVPDVPERANTKIPNFATVLDANTDLIADRLSVELEKLLNGKPWLVIAKFERKYIDANRPREHAYESDKAKPYYDAYHEPLEAACKAVKEKFGRGLLLDIHGQGEFRDSICRGTQHGKTVTLLKDRFGWPALTGKRSVLGHLQRSGYKILPSCDVDEKGKEEPKFTGGYIVGHYGSHTGYAIDAIQLEIGTFLRDKEKDKFATTAKDLADAVALFHDEYLKDAKGKP
ncbi:MAG: N-formylglutamate amidohydrolase [Gemmataceae bacterium]